MESEDWSKRFPEGAKRKKGVARSMRMITEEQKEQAKSRIKKKGPRWGYFDSGLDSGRGLHFMSTFRDILPRGESSFKGYIEKTLKEKKGHAIGIEFGGPGSTLFSGFSKGFFRRRPE